MPEDAFFVGLRNLAPAPTTLWREHGDFLHENADILNRTALAKKLGCSRDTLRAAIDFAEMFGGPAHPEAPQERDSRGSTFLIWPDSHARPWDRKKNYARFARLGRFARTIMVGCARSETRLHVINLGDLWGYGSLSPWDKKKKATVNANLAADLDAGKAAVNAFAEGLGDLEGDVNFHFMEGNHEDRWWKAQESIEAAPYMAGLPNHIDFLKAHALPWNVHRYLDPVFIEGVAVQHCFPGYYNKMISKASDLLSTHHVSCIAGHSHRREFAEAYKLGGGNLFSVISGCYMDEAEPWQKGTGQRQRSGVVLASGVRDGYLTGTLSFVSLASIIARVGE